MKILFIDFNRSYGGGQVYLKNVINQLVKLNVECWIVSNNPSKFFHDIQLSKGKCVEVPNSYFSFINIAKKVNSLIEDEYIDYVILNGNRAFYMVPLIKFKNITMITHSMPTLNTGMKFLISKFAIRFIANHYAKNVIVLSNIQKREMIKYGIKENLLHVIYNGINSEFFSEHLKNSDSNSDIIITEVALLEENKGHKELILVFFELLKHHRNIKLWIIGAGKKEYENQLKNMVKINKKDAEKVVFWGYQKNVKKFLKDTDIFVLPSHNECFPISILEAMASSLPIIASEVGGIPEIIENLINGYLVRAKNKSDLYEKLDTLIKDKNFRVVAGKNNYKKVKEKFTNERSVNNLLTVLNESGEYNE